jgi:hypothetical protein
MHLRTLGWAVKPAGATKAEAEATAAKARALESCEVWGGCETLSHPRCGDGRVASQTCRGGTR